MIPGKVVVVHVEAGDQLDRKLGEVGVVEGQRLVFQSSEPRDRAPFLSSLILNGDYPLINSMHMSDAAENMIVVKPWTRSDLAVTSAMVADRSIDIAVMLSVPDQHGACGDPLPRVGDPVHYYPPSGDGFGFGPLAATVAAIAPPHDPGCRPYVVNLATLSRRGEPGVRHNVEFFTIPKSGCWTYPEPR
jgi:hypothetical protein